MISKETIGLVDLTMLLRNNIKQAIRDYREHTDRVDILNDVSDNFIHRLAEDAAASKRDLRELFRKSPAWNEELQALVINGTRTHDPDYSRVRSLGEQILYPWACTTNEYNRRLSIGALLYFTEPNAKPDDVARYIAAIEELAPNAYRPRRKKSRIFKALCDALGVTNNNAGSNFQKLYAQFADELSAKKIDFKLFVSINPAHFITMSNPKHDRRGNMLTSCHSFNSTEYRYNNGCTGYARDDVTMIAFTVDDPSNPELLNNRKTTRQLFMYKVGNGLLLQSRMYNSGGGVYGASELTPLYRDLVQREISELEGVPNLWKTYTYCKDRPDGTDIDVHCGFGGYDDWIHEEFDAKLSIRLDHRDDFTVFEVGNYGLCIQCGGEIDEGLYCHDCNENCRCDSCHEYYDEDDMYMVHDRNGNEIMVCEDCRDANYSYCNHCEEYYPDRTMTRIANGDLICRNCYDEYYEQCDDCGEVHHHDYMNWVYDENGCEASVCDDCYHDHYIYCSECCNHMHESLMTRVHDCEGDEIWVCGDCLNEHYVKCEECGEYYHKDNVVDGLCPSCRAEESMA